MDRRSRSKPALEKQSFKNFRLGKMLGRGAFGYVYEAAVSHLQNEKVAIKIIEKRLLGAKGMMARVRNEIAIQGTLRHPNILRLYTYHEDAEFFYLVTEHCPVGELFHYVKRDLKRPLSDLECRAVIKGLVEGVACLHGRGIVHRDLKLSNLLLTAQHNVKIADFGFAVFTDRLLRERLTLCGTPSYLSPEALTRESGGFSVDIWSIGVIVYTLLVGRPPFEGSSTRETLKRIIECHYDVPSFISPPARDLICRLLRKNPMERVSLDDIRCHPFLFESIPAAPSSPSLDDLKSLVLSGLIPAQYSMAYGKLNVLEDGTLVLRMRDTYEAVRVHPAGHLMTLSRTIPDSDQVLFSAQYSRNNLPPPLRPLWLHLAQIVETLQAKSPKVILRAPNATAYLMSNEPEPDLTVKFSQPAGIECTYVPRKRLVFIKKRYLTSVQGHVQCRRYLVHLNTLHDNAAVSYKILKLIKHILHYYAVCLELSVKHEPSTKRGHRPLVFEYNKSQWRADHQPTTNGAVDGSSLSSYSLSLSSIRSRSEHSTTMTPKQMRPSSDGRWLERTLLSSDKLFATRGNSSVMMSASNRILPCSIQILSCDQDREGHFHIDYTDGSHLSIDPICSRVVSTTASNLMDRNRGSSQPLQKWMDIHEQLSPFVKERLALFYQHIQQGMQISMTSLFAGHMHEPTTGESASK